MVTEMNSLSLAVENKVFAGTNGVSANNRHLGFQPAFLNKETGEVEFSRNRDGSPAAMHLIRWLPKTWGDIYDDKGGILRLQESVVVGFSRDGVFYTRVEAAEL